ncbi:MAG: transglycosylase SLT domain-containing protein [Bradyrhizobium sp.]|uniref:lytic transglycosylase domain-containing protein n=1 Tax=Bradyrhizobium sp. TaxID=376 RepID=UPI001D83FF1D|nr:transglycosylase SLT domain-containing protein [Bradyrhizobium sp.]MBV9563252.1 transglycosylase SLT domain-containing protein [Bradyrhizobium sp.]
MSSFVTRYAAVDGPVAPKPPEAPTASTAEPPKPTLSVSPSAYSDTRAYYRALIEREATQQDLAPAIAEAVLAVESGYNADSVGTSGEIGLMQVMPSTARMLGFVGSDAELAVPETNIHLGVSYLAQAWRLAGGDLCTAVMKYRAGHGETRFSYLSVNYCLAVRSKLFARGFPVTGSVPAATFGEAVGSGGGGVRSCGRKCLAVTRIGKVDLAALNMKLSALVVQTRGGR